MNRRLSSAAATLAELVKVWGVIALIVAAGFLITYRYVGAPPPRIVRIATGPRDGAYFAFAQKYARLLARDGITLIAVPTAGSVENLALLEKKEVSLALVQGGCATREDRGQLQSLGALFLEPVWVFTASEHGIGRLTDLKGRRAAVGQEGSGTLRLSLQLLGANGIDDSNAALVREDTAQSLRGLATGQLDAAMLVSSPEAEGIRGLLGTPGIGLADLDRSASYAQLFPFLAPVTLTEGVLDLERNLPPRNTQMVAASASLAARRDLNESLIPALLDAVTRVHGPGGVLEQKGQFPSVELVDLELNDYARRYIRGGPSFLYRWLPYRTAVVLDRLKILLLPLFALLIPLVRVAPPLYQWRVRSKIYRWYGEVREIDAMLLADAPADRARLDERLRVLEREVASVSVPLAYTGEQYHLRLHIRLLQEELRREADACAPPESSGQGRRDTQARTAARFR